MSHATGHVFERCWCHSGKHPQTGELDYTPCGTKATKEEGRLAGFLRDSKEVPGKLLARL